MTLPVDKMIVAVSRAMSNIFLHLLPGAEKKGVIAERDGCRLWNYRVINDFSVSDQAERPN